MENERYAEMLNNPEAYAQEWGKKTTQEQELKKQIAQLEEENQKLKQELTAFVEQGNLPSKV